MSFYARQAFGLAGRPPSKSSNGGHRHQAPASSAQHHHQQHQRLTFQEDDATFEEVPIDGSIHAGHHDDHDFSQVTLSQAFSAGSNHSKASASAAARRWQQHRAESTRGKAAAGDRPRQRRDDGRDDRDAGRARRPGAPPIQSQRHHAQSSSRSSNGGSRRDRRHDPSSSRRQQEQHVFDEDAATTRSSQPLLNTQDIHQISGGQGRQQLSQQHRRQQPQQRDRAAAAPRPRQQHRPTSGGRAAGGASVHFEQRQRDHQTRGRGDDGATVQSRRSILSAIPPLRGRRRTVASSGLSQSEHPAAGRQGAAVATDREPYRTPLRSRSAPPPAQHREPSVAGGNTPRPSDRDDCRGRRQQTERQHQLHQQQQQQQQQRPSASALTRPASYLPYMPTPAKVVRSAIKLAGSLTPFARGGGGTITGRLSSSGAPQRTLLSQPPAGPPARVLRGALSMRTLGLMSQPTRPSSGREITPPPQSGMLPQGSSNAGTRRTPPPPGRSGPSGSEGAYGRPAAGPDGIRRSAGHDGDSGTRADSDASDSYGTAMDVEQGEAAAREARSLVRSVGDGTTEKQPAVRPVVDETSDGSAKRNGPEVSENASSDTNGKSDDKEAQEAPESSEPKAAKGASHSKAAEAQRQLDETLSKITTALHEVRREREQLDESRREFGDLRAKMEEDRARFESLKESLDARYGGLQKSIESFSAKMASTSHETGELTTVLLNGR